MDISSIKNSTQQIYSSLVEKVSENKDRIKRLTAISLGVLAVGVVAVKILRQASETPAHESYEAFLKKKYMEFITGFEKIMEQGLGIPAHESCEAILKKQYLQNGANYQIETFKNNSTFTLHSNGLTTMCVLDGISKDCEQLKVDLQAQGIKLGLPSEKEPCKLQMLKGWVHVFKNDSTLIRERAFYNAKCEKKIGYKITYNSTVNALIAHLNTYTGA